jgi:phosphatidylserine/phosphatidylglycerophosphate/cardiolipin synthase-like enzyme/DNA/RNA endonuclease YhcR with UshA esterase domain
MTKIYTLIILFFSVSFTTTIGQVITISDARAASEGTSVTISGIITNGSELGAIRYLQDETAGIAAYSYDKLKDVTRGDSVTISGTLKMYNGLLELDPIASIEVHAHNKILPEPVLLTPSQLGETYEGSLVRISNAVFSNGGSEFTSKKNYTFSANGQSAVIRINDDSSPFVSRIIPDYPVIITGILSEYSGTYQILVRELDDILSTNSVNMISVPVISDLTTTGFNLKWETDSTSTSEAFYGYTPELELGKLNSGEDTTGHTITISGADPSTLFYIQPFSVRGDDTARAAVKAYITQSESSGEITCYFNLPVEHSVSTGVDAITLDNTIDDTLIAYIDRAKYSIDMAIYHYDLYKISNISEALNNAHSRGVTVRVVYQASDEGDEAYIVNEDIKLLNAEIGKIESKTGDDYGIMHNKFLVFDAYSSDPDDALVWTGSTNFTDNQLHYDANNVIIIQDKSLAIAYTLEFNEMFGSDGDQPIDTLAKFGPFKTDNTPHEFIIGGSRVECYFSPSDGTTKHIKKGIESAESDLEIACMLITRSDLGRAVAAQSNSGIDAKVIENTYDQWNDYVADIMIDELDENFKTNGEGGNMHHKYMIADQSNSSSDPFVLTGSHNWTNAAETKNDENTLIVHDPVVVNQYFQDFTARFNNGAFMTDAPECINDFITMSSGSSITYDVLYNDDLPGTVEISIIDEPSHGNVVVNNDQTLTYTPENGFNAKIDTLKYKACLKENTQICSEALFVIYVNKPVSVDQVNSYNITFYPLPAREQLTINASNVALSSYKIFDITGKNIFMSKLNDIQSETININLSDFSDGMYYIRLYLADGNTITQKIVIDNN